MMRLLPVTLALVFLAPVLAHAQDKPAPSCEAQLAEAQEQNLTWQLNFGKVREMRGAQDAVIEKLLLDKSGLEARVHLLTKQIEAVAPKKPAPK